MVSLGLALSDLDWRRRLGGLLDPCGQWLPADLGVDLFSHDLELALQLKLLGVQLDRPFPRRVLAPAHVAADIAEELAARRNVALAFAPVAADEERAEVAWRLLELVAQVFVTGGDVCIARIDHLKEVQLVQVEQLCEAP